MKSQEQQHRHENEWREPEAAEIARAAESRRSAGVRFVRLSTVVLASALGAYVLMGCGQHKSHELTQSSSEHDGLVVAQPASATPPSEQQTPVTTEGAPREAAKSADAVPPEVEATVTDSTVVRGSVVEVTAEGSADVVAMSLKDDLGTELPMAYDSASQVWRAFYRVPLKSKSERVGLAVTAKNATGRWRRVYEFLQVEHEGGREPVANPEH
jgi:hypothetical protein